MKSGYLYENLLAKGKAGRLSGPPRDGACGPARRMGGGQYARRFAVAGFHFGEPFVPPGL